MSQTDSITTAGKSAGGCYAVRLVIYSALNFHHYIVDSFIWKMRKPKIQKTLGLNEDAKAEAAK